MSLADDLAHTERRRPGPKCNLSKVLRKLDSDTQAALMNVVMDEEKGPSEIQRVMEDHGFHLTEWTIRRHRNSQCVTCKEAG